MIIYPPDHSINAAPLTPFSPSNASDATCVWAGPGSAGALFGSVKYASYSVLVCQYSGGSSQLLNQGESFSITYSADIDPSSDLSKASYVVTNYDYTNDREYEAYLVDNCSNAPEAIDCVLENPINNAAYSGAPTDVELTAEYAANPLDLSPGSPVSYVVTLKNNGPGDIDLTLLNNVYQAAVAGTVYPADDLEFTSFTGTNLACTDLGPGSNTYLGLAGSAHPDHQLLPCFFSGGTTILPSGASYQYTLNFTVKPNVSSEFTNYFYNPNVPNDADSAEVYSSFTNASGDILDTFSGNNNFFRLAYTSSGGANGGSGNSSSQNQGSSLNGQLSETGRSMLLIFGASLTLVTLALLGLNYSRKKSRV